MPFFSRRSSRQSGCQHQQQPQQQAQPSHGGFYGYVPTNVSLSGMNGSSPYGGMQPTFPPTLFNQGFPGGGYGPNSQGGMFNTLFDDPYVLECEHGDRSWEFPMPPGWTPPSGFPMEFTMPCTFVPPPDFGMQLAMAGGPNALMGSNPSTQPNLPPGLNFPMAPNVSGGPSFSRGSDMPMDLNALFNSIVGSFFGQNQQGGRTNFPSQEPHRNDLFRFLRGG